MRRRSQPTPPGPADAQLAIPSNDDFRISLAQVEQAILRMLGEARTPEVKRVYLRRILKEIEEARRADQSDGD